MKTLATFKVIKIERATRYDRETKETEETGLLQLLLTGANGELDDQHYIKIPESLAPLVPFGKTVVFATVEGEER